MGQSTRTGYPGVVGGADGAHYLGVVSVPDHYNIYICHI